jgi:hypothetical protein
MTTVKNVKISNEEGVELLASEVKLVAEGARRLLNGRLTERAILVLIHDAIPGKNVGYDTIATVLNHAALIDQRYLKKVPTK